MTCTLQQGTYEHFQRDTRRREVVAIHPCRLPDPTRLPLRIPSPNQSLGSMTGSRYKALALARLRLRRAGSML